MTKIESLAPNGTQSPATPSEADFFVRDFEGSPVRMAKVADGILFGAFDTAKALGYLKPGNAINDHCSTKGVCVLGTPTKGGVQALKYLKKGAVNELILASRLPTAQRFKEWVCYEVLVDIQETGAYQASPQFPVSQRAQQTTADAVNKLVSTNRALADQVIQLANRIADYTIAAQEKQGTAANPQILLDLDQPDEKPERLTLVHKGSRVLKGCSGEFTKHQFAEMVNREFPGTYNGKRAAKGAYATLCEMERRGMVTKIRQGGLRGVLNVWRSTEAASA